MILILVSYALDGETISIVSQNPHPHTAADTLALQKDNGSLIFVPPTQKTRSEPELMNYFIIY